MVQVAEHQLQADRGNASLKFLDRNVGIPAVWAVGLWRRLRGRRSIPADWQTIGLVKLAGIGDTMLLSAVVRDLRRARPGARIVLFVNASNAPFAELLDDVDALVVLSVRNIAEAVRMVRAQHCDVVVDFGAWARLESLLTVLSGARATVGMRTEGQHRALGYDVVVEHNTGHELENYRRLVATMGIRTASLPDLPVDAVRARPQSEPYAVAHLWPGGSNFEERSWPEGAWRALAVALNERDLAVVLTGGPGDIGPTDRIVEAWRAAGIRVQSVAGTSPVETLRWLYHAVGVVSVNTGVMHIAATCGAPVVALNGPTSSRRWGPVGEHTRCVSSPMVPDGYLNLGFERDDRYRDCMAAISVDAVLAAWDDLQREVTPEDDAALPGG